MILGGLQRASPQPKRIMTLALPFRFYRNVHINNINGQAPKLLYMQHASIWVRLSYENSPLFSFAFSPCGGLQGIMPGGVSSPVRAFKSVGGNPIVFDRVKGAYAYDVDG